MTVDEKTGEVIEVAPDDVIDEAPGAEEKLHRGRRKKAAEDTDDAVTNFFGDEA